MKQMLKLGLSLAIYAAVSCFCLALVNNVTKPTIDNLAKQALQAGLKEVFADASEFEAVDGMTSSAGVIKSAYKALDSNKNTIGAIVEIYGKTYDKSDILIGIKNDDGKTITGVKFLSTTDSPGFGSKAADPKFTLSNGKTFYGQFAGKKAADGFTLGEDYDAIGGATITSRSVGALLDGAATVANTAMAK